MSLTRKSIARKRSNRKRDSLCRFESLESRDLLTGDAFSWEPAPSRGHVIVESTGPLGNGWETQGTGVAMTNLDEDSRLEMVSLFVDNPEGENRLYYRVGWNLNEDGLAEEWTPTASRGYLIEEATNSLGAETQGAGVTFAFLDDDPRPEMVTMFVEDREFDNTIRYRIGWNIDEAGIASDGWTPNSRGFAVTEGPPQLGWETAGAGISILQLDENPMPELLTLFVDNAVGENVMYYRIGWNVNSSGVVTDGWTPDRERGHIVPSGPDGLGEETQGAGVTVGNIDDDPRPEIIASYVHDGERSNSMHYRIGWNINALGIPTGGWTPGDEAGFTIVGGRMGWETQGAGLALADFNGDFRPDLVASFVDNPEFGNTFYYQAGTGQGPVQAESIDVRLELSDEARTLYDVQVLLGTEGFDWTFREIDTFAESTIGELESHTWSARVGETLRVHASTKRNAAATDVVLASNDDLLGRNGVEIGEHSAGVTLLGSSEVNDLELLAAGFVKQVLPGDIDRDGSVGFTDFLAFSANFGREDASFGDGDFDRDGDVDFLDFLALSGNFGESLA